MPRLAVRATVGHKAFIFEDYLNRRTVRVTLGDVDTWTLAAARKEARRLQTLIDRGLDPREEKAERKAAARAEREAAKAARQAAKEAESYTLAALLDASVAHLRAKGKTMTARDAASAFKRHLVGKHHCAWRSHDCR